MKLNIAYPVTGGQKIIDLQEENKLRAFMGKRISDKVIGDQIGEEFNGYEFIITGGNDKQGFPMLQGVLTTGRVRLILKAGDKCYRPRRDGERRRKSVRGCIVSKEISVLSLIIVKKGDSEIPGITDIFIPPTRIPKRASKLIRYLNEVYKSEGKEANISHKNLISNLPLIKVKSKNPEKEGRIRYKKIKVQRLVTARRAENKLKKIEEQKKARIRSKEAAIKYKEMLESIKKEKIQQGQLV